MAINKIDKRVSVGGSKLNRMVARLKLVCPERILRKIFAFYNKKKIKNIRNKNEITVLFIINDISKWKSEELYLLMKKHPRFLPILGVTIRNGESPSALSHKVLDIIKYFEYSKYEYIELTETINPAPDIIIYTEPYGGVVPIDQSVFTYWNSLLISIPYSCHTTSLPIDYFTRVHECAWLDCYESSLSIDNAYKCIGIKRKSIQLTGLPMFDVLRSPAKRDPWKKQDVRKKRIIWAPHHSLGGFHFETIVYSNFIEMSQLMVDLAEKYNDSIQIAFKPHPLLREKLNSIWGKIRTDKYFQLWESLSNGQLETGEYVDLFKFSDALIHDSSSFIVEYQVVDKPSLFVVRNEEEILNDMNDFGKKAFYSQTLAYSVDDIEPFIKQIINDKDPNEEKRKEFLNRDIFGIDDIGASQHIIDKILGK